MKTLKIIIKLIILGVVNCCAQNNLVLNGSFEDTDLCPNYVNLPYNYNRIFFCSNPNGGSPDYFKSCFNSQFNSFSVPSNFLGFQTAKTGNAYIGIGIWEKDYVLSEYVQIKLSEGLKCNHHYFFECFLSRAEMSRYATANFGVYFSVDSVFDPSFGILPFSPQIENTTSNFLSDTSDWISFTGTYLANGAEHFIILGNFNDTTQSVDTMYQYYGSVNHRDGAYYYIDDVSLIDLDSTLSVEENVTMAQVELFPNPASSILTIKLNETHQHYSIQDIKGNTLMQNNINKQEQLQLDITALPSGFYMISFIDSHGMITREKFVKM